MLVVIKKILNTLLKIFNLQIINRLSYKKLLIEQDKFLAYSLFNISDYLENDLIITDWSGSAVEFALATKKRYIFLETKQKIFIFFKK
jgi:hypothetical protein